MTSKLLVTGVALAAVAMGAAAGSGAMAGPSTPGPEVRLAFHGPPLPMDPATAVKGNQTT